jgi:hypothetical protein
MSWAYDCAGIDQPEDVFDEFGVEFLGADGDSADLLLPDDLDAVMSEPVTDAASSPQMPISESEDDSGSEIERLVYLPGQLGAARRGAIRAFQRLAPLSGAGSVVTRFADIIGGTPTKEALIGVRLMFQCTGPVTREQRRNWKKMAAAFEPCADLIHSAMENFVIFRQVTDLLVRGSQVKLARKHC